MELVCGSRIVSGECRREGRGFTRAGCVITYWGTKDAYVACPRRCWSVRSPPMAPHVVLFEYHPVGGIREAPGSFRFVGNSEDSESGVLGICNRNHCITEARHHPPCLNLQCREGPFRRSLLDIRRGGVMVAPPVASVSPYH